MDHAALNDISDVQTLRAMVLAQQAQIAVHEQTIAQRDHAIAFKDAKISKLTHEIARLRRVQFTAKSERMDPAQRELFDEAMAADIAALEAELDALREPAKPASRTVPKPPRRSLPPELPRIETIHEPASCDCATCGAALVKIGEHVSEKLDVEPMRFFVRHDIHPQYACRRCETVVAEPVAPAILDRGLAAPGLLAQVAIQKYTDSRCTGRRRSSPAPASSCRGRPWPSGSVPWAWHCSRWWRCCARGCGSRRCCMPTKRRWPSSIPGAGKTKRAYLFAYRRPGMQPMVVFDYCASRAGKHAAAFLDTWRGALMVDDYSGYKALFAAGVTELACWAHARRTFADAHKASGSPLAGEAIERIADALRRRSETT